MEAEKDIIRLSSISRTFDTIDGETVLVSLKRKGIFLRNECGGIGKCGKCAVDLIEDGSIRRSLSCELKVKSCLLIDIPSDSLISFENLKKSLLKIPKNIINANGDRSGKFVRIFALNI